MLHYIELLSGNVVAAHVRAGCREGRGAAGRLHI